MESYERSPARGPPGDRLQQAHREPSPLRPPIIWTIWRHSFAVRRHASMSFFISASLSFSQILMHSSQHSAHARQQGPISGLTRAHSEADARQIVAVSRHTCSASAWSFLPATSCSWQWWKPASHSSAHSLHVRAAIFACSSCSPRPLLSACRACADAPAPAASPAAVAPKTANTSLRSMVVLLSRTKLHQLPEYAIHPLGRQPNSMLHLGVVHAFLAVHLHVLFLVLPFHLAHAHPRHPAHAAHAQAALRVDPAVGRRHHLVSCF